MPLNGLPRRFTIGCRLDFVPLAPERCNIQLPDRFVVIGHENAHDQPDGFFRGRIGCLGFIPEHLNSIVHNRKGCLEIDDPRICCRVQKLRAGLQREEPPGPWSQPVQQSCTTIPPKIHRFSFVTAPEPGRVFPTSLFQKAGLAIVVPIQKGPENPLNIRETWAGTVRSGQHFAIPSPVFCKAEPSTRFGGRIKLQRDGVGAKK